MVFRTGLLDAADACDIGVPAVPLQQLHGDAATAALESAGVRVAPSTPVRRAEGRRVLLEEETHAADAVIVAVPHETVARIVPPEAVDADALAALGSSPIVNLHIALRPARAGRAVRRRRGRLAAAMAVRPHASV